MDERSSNARAVGFETALARLPQPPKARWLRRLRWRPVSKTTVDPARSVAPTAPAVRRAARRARRTRCRTSRDHGDAVGADLEDARGRCRPGSTQRDAGQRVGALGHQLGASRPWRTASSSRDVLGADGEVHRPAHGGDRVRRAGVPVGEVAARRRPGRRRARRRRGGRRASSRTSRRGGSTTPRAVSTTGTLPALIRSGSISSPTAARPMPSMPFSVCSTTPRSRSRWSATSVGWPMPRLTNDAGRDVVGDQLRDLVLRQRSSLMRSAPPGRRRCSA